MSSKLQKLTFSVDALVGKATGKLGKVQQSLESIAQKTKAAFWNIGMGGAGVLGAAQGIQTLVQPAFEFNNAMRDVKSLDVHDKAMSALARKSLLYSVKYGEGAAGFISSSYDIQSAIQGLEGADLGNFTNASNVLAKATKADAATITNYMGTMYGIFKTNAEAMGKSNWVEKITGQTATAVKMFKTTGMEMSGAFSAIGAAGQSAGISAAEQFAVLGTLQATMSGSEAGTKYKAFLDGVGAAQKKLGLRFTDSQGKLLPMIQIMEKLQGKFGDTLNLAESDALKSAFGSGEAVALVKLLMNDTDNLSASIQKLTNITGMQNAEAMAMARVDPSQRMRKGFDALQIVIGRTLTPALDSLFNWIGDITTGIVGWAEAYPQVTKVIGYAGLAILSLTGILGLLTMAAGFGKIMMIGWAGGVSAWTTVTKVATFFTNGWRTAQMLLNAAFAANPIGVVIVGILAGITALVALLPYLSGLWDKFKNSFGDTWWGKALIGVLDPVMNWLKSLGKAVGWVLEKLGLSFEFSGSTKVEQQAIQAGGPTSPVMDSVFSAGANQAAPTVPQVQSLQQMKQTSVPAGGIKQELVNISNQSKSSTSNGGSVTQNFYGPHSNTNEQFALEMS